MDRSKIWNSKMTKHFLCPDNIPKRWIDRFKLLEFTFDSNGCLYSPKKWNDNWDNQIKSLWLRTVGMGPEKIAIKLNVGLSSVKNYWLSTITRNYKLIPINKYDWSTIGFVDITGERYIRYGGTQDLRHHGKFKDDGGLDIKISPILTMESELLQLLHDYREKKKAYRERD